MNGKHLHFVFMAIYTYAEIMTPERFRFSPSYETTVSAAKNNKYHSYFSWEKKKKKKTTVSPQRRKYKLRGLRKNKSFLLGIKFQMTEVTSKTLCSVVPSRDVSPN